MYCISCGAELPDQARFCMMCGTPVGGAVQVASTAESDSQELDRRALEVYLESLLALECAKHKHEKRCEVLEPHSWPDDDWLITRTYEAGQWSRGKPMYITFAVDADDTIYVRVFSESGAVWIYYDLEGLHNSSGDPIEGEWCDVESPSAPKWRLAQQAEAYDEFASLAPSLAQERRDYIATIRQELEDREYNIDWIQGKLDEAYGLNIIPKQFRNIYAVHFLSDFISTSRESLSTAMLHCNLNEIKARLDRILDKEVEIILNQEAERARDEQAMKQTEAMLEQLQSVAANSATAAGYAGILSARLDAIEAVMTA